MWFTKNAKTTEANKTSAIPMHFKNCAKFKVTLRLLVSMVTNQRWDAFKVFMIFLFFFLFFLSYAFFAKYQSRRMSLICYERIYELVYYFIYKKLCNVLLVDFILVKTENFIAASGKT